MKIHSVNTEALFGLINLTELIRSPDDLNKVLHTLVEKIASITNADACSLYLYNSSSDDITLKATFGLNEKLVDQLVVKLTHHTPTCETLKQLKPVSITDVRKSKTFLVIQDLGEEGLLSFLSVPLIYNGSPVGVLTIQNKKPTVYAKNDVEVLLSLSVSAVALIEKAKFMGTMGGVLSPSATPSVPTTQPEKKKTDVTVEYLKDHFLKGIPAVPGITMGRLKIIRRTLARRTEVHNKQGIKLEIERLKEAFKYIAAEIQETKKKAEAKFGPDEASIFEAYLLFLQSESFQQQIIAEIQNEVSAATALDRVVTKYMERVSNAQDEYIKERAYDIQDVANKIRDHLLYGTPDLEEPTELKEDTIVCNDMWSVTDFIDLDTQKIKGIISPSGSANSHIAILADTLNLTAVLGMGTHTDQLSDGDYVIIDGFSGTVIVNPSTATIETYRRATKDLQKHEDHFQTKKHQIVKLGPIDKKRFFPIGANLGMVAHVASALDAGADMVGLYRTEFPFFVRKTLPTEEEQYHIYKRAVELMRGRQVVFRTLDIGGDKHVPYLNLPKEANPALGWRAIRFSLERKDLFRVQLRAILRASAHGRVRLLLPMITCVDQVKEVREILESVKKELTDENIKFEKHVPLGAMIEVPSAVQIADRLAHHVEFFSIGTNDLIQYSMAVDRANPLVSKLYDPFHPAIVKMIAHTVREAHKHNIDVTVCGDAAANPLFSAILIGLGVDSLSMLPRSIPKLKTLARLIDEASVIQLAKKCLRLETGAKIKRELEYYFKVYELNEFLEEPHPTTPNEGETKSLLLPQ